MDLQKSTVNQSFIQSDTVKRTFEFVIDFDAEIQNQAGKMDFKIGQSDKFKCPVSEKKNECIICKNFAFGQNKECASCEEIFCDSCLTDPKLVNQCPTCANTETHCKSKDS